MKNKKKLITIVMVALCVAALTVGSLALFTDRYQAEVNVTAGTVDLALEEYWQSANSTVGESFKPGTGLVLDYTLSNGGNLAARVKETFVISSDKDLNDSNPEFAIYAGADVDVAADGTVTIAANAAPLSATVGSYTVEGTTWHKLTYDLGQSIMNGSIENVGNYQRSKAGEYVLVFRSDAGNEFQSAQLKIEYMAQALQYTNTGDSTWNEAKVISSTVDFGGVNDMSVVPELVINP